MDAPTTPAAAQFIPDRPAWVQVLALFGSFLSALGLGFSLGSWAQPGGDITGAILAFALLTIFIGGMAIWGSIAATIMARTIFNGDLAAAFLRFLLRRRREDLPKLNLDPQRILDAAKRVYGWTRVFVWLGVATACIAAPIAGLTAERGFIVTALPAALVLVAYGFAIRALAMRGYLIPPDVE